MSKREADLNKLARTVFFRNLDPSVTIDEIEGLCVEIGPIEKTAQVYDSATKETGVEIIFANIGDAKVLMQLNGEVFKSSPLKIESAVFKAPPKPEAAAAGDDGTDAQKEEDEKIEELPENHKVPLEHRVDTKIVRYLVQMEKKVKDFSAWEGHLQLNPLTMKPIGEDGENTETLYDETDGLVPPCKLLDGLREVQARITVNNERISELKEQIKAKAQAAMPPAYAPSVPQVPQHTAPWPSSSDRLERTLVCFPVPSHIDMCALVCEIIKTFGPVTHTVRTPPAEHREKKGAASENKPYAAYFEFSTKEHFEQALSALTTEGPQKGKRDNVLLHCEDLPKEVWMSTSQAAVTQSVPVASWADVIQRTGAANAMNCYAQFQQNVSRLLPTHRVVCLDGAF